MSYRYIGAELDLFAAAANWKAYMARRLRPFIGGRVLEVGAGIGGNTVFLHNARVRGWICLEPDPDLAGRIERRLEAHELPPGCRVVTGTTAAVDPGAGVDTILYLDVLEHIAEDGAELARAAQLLSPDGNLVVLAPAHQSLFTPFDAAVGHYRRYNRATLQALTPPGCRLEANLMLDSAGFFASLANRLLLSSSMPSPRQIAVWDKLLVPISRLTDRVTGHRFGRTIVVVWRRVA
ncbi:MAG TPA: class I SAM-dependent methyltransferase [Stellaceae bacterium]|nr:class I SAM-dependent methyltransferase [Stellaceae bacterium]